MWRIHSCIIKYPLSPFSTGNTYAELTFSRFNRCVAFLPWQAGHHVKTWTVGHWAVRFRSALDAWPLSSPKVMAQLKQDRGGIMGVHMPTDRKRSQ